MKKTALFLVVLAVAALATSTVAISNAPQPLTTHELMWDNGTYGDILTGTQGRAVWFTMPFDAKIVGARVFIPPGAANPAGGFEAIFYPRDSNGLPDVYHPYYGSKTARGGRLGQWLDVDFSSYMIFLNSGDEFYLCCYVGGIGEPDVACDTGSSGSHNAWYDGSAWHPSSVDAYMFRVVVDDSSSQVELSTWGQLKALDN